MAIDPNQIVAAAPTAPAAEEIIPTAEAPAPAEDTTGDIPDEVLQIPMMRGLLEGKPAAVYDVTGSKIPVMEAIPRNAKSLVNAGIGFYKSKDKALNVMFNTQFIPLSDIEKADKEGKLTEVAEPLGAVLSAYDSVLNEGAAPAAAPSAMPVSNTPAPVQRKLTTARLQNISLGTPTSGPAPGGGRVFNNVLKRAV